MNFHDNNSLHSIFHQVMRFYHQRNHMLLDKIGIYPGQPFMLFALYNKDGQSQKDLAEKLGIRPPTITKMVKRMGKSGLIERKQDTEDQRVSRVYITEKGKGICKEINEVRKIIEAESFSNFTEEELILLRRLLMQIRHNLEKACQNS